MATQLFANNAASVLASSLTNVATSLTVTTGHGARFPSPSGGDYFLATLCQQGSAGEINFEIVKVTARSTDSFTIVRAQESTTALAYNAGDKVELRLTKETMESLRDFARADTGAVTTTVRSKLKEFVSVFDFMTATQISDAKGTTSTGSDHTSAIQAAMTANRYIRVPAGRYKLSSTLTMQTHGAALIGDGPDTTIFERTATYGDTLKIGTSGTGAGNFEISGIYFYKPQTYVAGTTTTITLAASAGAAHINVIGGQRAKIQDCFFWNMPYGVILETCSSVRVENNDFFGIWDYAIAGLQEGIAELYLKSDGSGFNSLITVSGNYFTGGYFSVSRSITVGSISYNTTQQIGPRWGILVDAVEGLDVTGNYLGGQNDYCILFQPNHILAGVRITNNWFDAGLIGSINCVTTGASFYVVNLEIMHNEFNGQLVSLEALRIDYPASLISAVGLILANNRIANYLKTAVMLTGVTGALISNNLITNYHARGGGTGDPSYAAGIRVLTGATHVVSSNNQYGGGVNDLSATNNCQWGIHFSSASQGMASHERAISLGLSGGITVSGLAVGTYIRLNTANGYGSANTRIRRFTNIVDNTGPDITYADSATLGATFTINTTGIYSVSYSDHFDAASQIGISFNSTQLSTNISSATVADVLAEASTSAANAAGSVSATFYAIPGTVIRAHTNGAPAGTTTNACQFMITRIA